MNNVNYKDFLNEADKKERLRKEILRPGSIREKHLYKDILNIDDLNDVVISSPNDLDVLTYNSDKQRWEPQPNSGEANTASNKGVGGVGVFIQKIGVDLEFKNINAGSSKVTVTDDTSNKEIDIDISEGNIDHDSLLNFVLNEHIDWKDATDNLKTTGNIYCSNLGVNNLSPSYNVDISGDIRISGNVGTKLGSDNTVFGTDNFYSSTTSTYIYSGGYRNAYYASSGVSSIMLGRQNAYSATGSVSYSLLTGYQNALSATGIVIYSNIFGYQNAYSATNNINSSIMMGYRNAYSASDSDLISIIAMPYECFYGATSSSLDYAIAIGHQAGKNTSYDSPALFGKAAMPDDDNQVVIGSSFYTGYIKLDNRVKQGAPNSAIADADLWNGSASLYIDESNHKIIFKVKYSDSTIKTWEGSLT